MSWTSRSPPSTGGCARTTWDATRGWLSSWTTAPSSWWRCSRRGGAAPHSSRATLDSPRRSSLSSSRTPGPPSSSLTRLTPRQLVPPLVTRSSAWRAPSFVRFSRARPCPPLPGQSTCEQRTWPGCSTPRVRPDNPRGPCCPTARSHSSRCHGWPTSPRSTRTMSRCMPPRSAMVPGSTRSPPPPERPTS